MSLCWVSLGWVSLCWVSWHHTRIHSIVRQGRKTLPGTNALAYFVARQWRRKIFFWHFSTDCIRNEISRIAGIRSQRPVSKVNQVLLLPKLLVNVAFCQLDILSMRYLENIHFVSFMFSYFCLCVSISFLLDILSMWHFVKVTFCQGDILSRWHFVNLTFLTTWLLPMCHFINLSFYQLVILLTCHFINLSFYQLVILSTCHFFNLSFYQLVILSTWHYLILSCSDCHFINSSFCHFIILSFWKTT